ncbi:MAG: hypothetical protein AB7P33_05045 [Dehalococcoidia bacterium]
MRQLAVVLFAVFALFAAAGFVPAGAQQPPLATTTISGGGLPHSVRLAPADHEAFMNRLNLPPLFDDAPEVGGPSYTVVSPYWDAGVRAGDNTQVLVDDDATYYPGGGFVRTRQQGEDIWTALDTRQRAILDRYIAVAAEVPAEPAIFEVMRAAGLKGEDIAITIGAIELTKDQRTRFWDNARSVSPRQGPAPTAAELAAAARATPGPSAVFIVFTLPEGRSVSMTYSNVSGTLVEQTEGAKGLGIPVPRDWLVPVLGEQARFNPSSNPLAPVAIEQEHTEGSPLWLLLTLGGGMASIALAIVLQRKLKAMHGTRA